MKRFRELGFVGAAVVSASATHLMCFFRFTQQRYAVNAFQTSSVRFWRQSASISNVRFFTAKVSSEPNTALSEAGKIKNERISRGNVDGLDARVVVENLDMVLSHLKSRRVSQDTLQAALDIEALNSERVELIIRRDKALNVRKEQSSVVGKLLKEASAFGDNTDEQRKDALEQAKQASSQAADEAAAAEEALEAIEKRTRTLLAGIPNVIDDCVPEGCDDSENELVETWGELSHLPAILGWSDGFEPKWHDEIAAGLNGWMSEEAVKISGARFVALSGQVARLERALGMFFMDLHTSPEHGYTEVNVPFVVSRSTLEGTSQLPKFEEDLFKITPESHTCNGEDAFLIPTAEVPLTNLFRDSILNESDLPLSFVSLTPCFRAEAGSAGRDTRGLVRTHQFLKCELVKITRPEDSDAEHEALTRHAQACLEALKLPYRKVRLCSGDIGFSARHCYDLEVWLPGQGLYREISSCSNTGDFQAKRMGLRYRPNETDDGNKKKKPKPKPCHTINGSGLAVGRALVAVLENYQRPDGTVVVPDVLRQYMGVEVLGLKD